VLLAALAAILLAAIGLAVFVWVVQRALLFPARVETAPMPRAAAPDGVQAWLDVDGARVEAWLLPARRPGPAPLLVFAHGNGELIDDWAGAFEPAREFGAAVLLVEYPGYGRSSGSPGERSIARTMVASYDWARAQPGVDPARMVGYGRSLGGGAVCALARERPLAALVLESTFTSVRALARRLSVPGFLVRDPFDNARTVAAFAGPILIVHGDLDTVAPVENAHRLAELARSATLRTYPECGHNDCPRPWSALREFLLAHGLLALAVR
jgi:fermentation-respiration switch protein FrsA (DUF1100 family)